MDEREQKAVAREAVATQTSAPDAVIHPLLTRDTEDQKAAIQDQVDLETLEAARAIGDIRSTPIIRTTSLEEVIEDESIVKHIIYPDDIELPPDVEFLIEPLAAHAHATWSNWMLWLFRFGKKNADGTFTIQADRVARWERQMNTFYQFLPEEEKESDREEAREILKVLHRLLM